MKADLEVLRAKFLKAYSSVPDKLRDDVVAVVDDKTYSWNSAFIEVNGKTPLGDKIIRKLEEIGMFGQK
ncbi:Uncharacterised protein [Candidatus Gugararchaeum adminiculabundum]|nr:Uncharacterised protein [Candidatus Gugararchaeum adminiculabundum]